MELHRGSEDQFLDIKKPRALTERNIGSIKKLCIFNNNVCIKFARLITKRGYKASSPQPPHNNHSLRLLESKLASSRDFRWSQECAGCVDPTTFR